MFAEELLKAGANPEIADETGTTAAMAAKKLNDPFMDALLKKSVPQSAVFRAHSILSSLRLPSAFPASGPLTVVL